MKVYVVWSRDNDKVVIEGVFEDKAAAEQCERFVSVGWNDDSGMSEKEVFDAKTVFVPNR